MEDEGEAIETAVATRRAGLYRHRHARRPQRSYPPCRRQLDLPKFSRVLRLGRRGMTLSAEVVAPRDCGSVINEADLFARGIVAGRLERRPAPVFLLRGGRTVLSRTRTRLALTLV